MYRSKKGVSRGDKLLDASAEFCRLGHTSKSEISKRWPARR